MEWTYLSLKYTLPNSYSDCHRVKLKSYFFLYCQVIFYYVLLVAVASRVYHVCHFVVCAVLIKAAELSSNLKCQARHALNPICLCPLK